MPSAPAGAPAGLVAIARPDPLPVAVVMEREAQPNGWEAWRFRVAEVVPDEGEGAAVLSDDGRLRRTRHPGLAVELHTDEGEGYHLNLSSPQPVWFVMWRLDEGDPSEAEPVLVTLSYNEAARWLDAQERVDNTPLPPEVAEWLSAYTAQHYRPEPKQRKRPASFQRPGDRSAPRRG